MNKKILLVSCVILIIAVAVTVTKVSRAGGEKAPVNIESADITMNFAGEGSDDMSIGGSTSDDWNVGGNLAVTGTSAFTGKATFAAGVSTLGGQTAVAQTGATSTVTLTAANSGTTYMLSATGTTITLPAVTNTGANFKFQVNGAMGVANMIVASAEGDNIEGTLIVAGAVVDCAAEDQINFVVDGENIGDYFEIMSDGTQWLLGDSGVLTAAKLTCTDPA